MEKKYKTFSYRDASLYRILHKKGIKKINSLIEKSQTRFSMSKFFDGHNDSPGWCFGLDECHDDSPGWCFGLDEGDILISVRMIRFQCINCKTCGEYIDNCDMSKLPTNILCNVLGHHASLHAIILSNYRLNKNDSSIYKITF